MWDLSVTSNTPTCKNYWLSAFQCPSTDPAGNEKLLSSCGTNTMSVITIRYPFLQCLTSWLPFHNNECTMKTYMVGSQIHYTYSFTILVHNILKSKHVQCISCVINFLSKGCGWHVQAHTFPFSQIMIISWHVVVVVI